MVSGGHPLYLKFRVNRPRWSEIADCEQIISNGGNKEFDYSSGQIN